MHSALSPAECITKISEQIDTGFSRFGSRPVTGKISESSLLLVKRKPYANSFHTILHATLRSAGSGTDIEGEFAVGTFVVGFYKFWLMFASAFVGLGCVICIWTLPSGNLGGVNFLLTSCAIFVFGIFLPIFCRHMARDEAPFLADFLRRTLSAGESQDKKQKQEW